MGETFAETKATIEQLASKSFAAHELTKEGPEEWRCGRPGTVIYSFRVLCRPGMATVWGDLGEWVLRHGDRDSLGWLRGAVSSPDYMLSKIKAGQHERFYAADALSWLRSEEAVETYGVRRVGEARDFLESADHCLPQHEWLDACYRAGMDDPPRFECSCEGALWLVECLRKFVALEATAAAREVGAGRG